MPIASRILVTSMLMVTLVTMVTWQLTVEAKCQPTTTKPDLKSIQVKNVVSLYRGVVANMAGYLELLNSTGQSTYLPLDIKSVSVSQPDFFGYRIITLSEECFTLYIGYAIEAADHPSEYTFHLTGIDLMVARSDAEQNDTPKEICDLDQVLDLKLPDNFRYSCKEVLSHQCSLAKKPIAKLVLKSFELDLDGYPANVKEGVFTESPLKDSCSYWNK